MACLSDAPMRLRKASFLACLLAVSCAAVAHDHHRVPVGVISTEGRLQYLSISRSGFVATHRRRAAAYDLAISHATEQLLEGVKLPAGQSCKVALILLPGGEVMRVEPAACSFEASDLKTIIDALTGKLLPYEGFESVFQREAHLALCTPKGPCSGSAVDSN